MRLTQLQYLLEIKKQGSISKAAQHLYIAQPSMSAAIKELEEELGYELMKRSKKGVTFTSLGEQVTFGHSRRTWCGLPQGYATDAGGIVFAGEAPGADSGLCCDFC